MRIHPSSFPTPPSDCRGSRRDSRPRGETPRQEPEGFRRAPGGSRRPNVPAGDYNKRSFHSPLIEGVGPAGANRGDGKNKNGLRTGPGRRPPGSSPPPPGRTCQRQTGERTGRDVPTSTSPASPPRDTVSTIRSVPPRPSPGISGESALPAEEGFHEVSLVHQDPLLHRVVRTFRRPKKVWCVCGFAEQNIPEKKE